MRQNHMFDVAFSLDSDRDWQDVTNGELIVALARRLEILRLEYRYRREEKHDEAFGYCDSSTLEEADRRSSLIGYKDSHDVGEEETK